MKTLKQFTNDCLFRGNQFQRELGNLAWIGIFFIILGAICLLFK
jgi:hypothetical protein